MNTIEDAQNKLPFSPTEELISMKEDITADPLRFVSSVGAEKASAFICALSVELTSRGLDLPAQGPKVSCKVGEGDYLALEKISRLRGTLNRKQRRAFKRTHLSRETRSKL